MLRRLGVGSNCTVSRDFSHAALIVRTVEKDLQKSGSGGLFLRDWLVATRPLCVVSYACHADESGVDDD